jgi:peptide/nickel transport system substrate-binding protein
MRSRHHSLIAILAILAACSGNEGGTNGSGGGTLIVAQVGDATQLLPPLVGDQTGHAVQDMVFDRLAEIGPDMNTVGDKGFTPRLAKSWTWSADSLSIAFSIDPRAKWHDGQPVTADDIKYSFQLFTDPKVGSPNASLFTNIDSIQVRDSLTAVAWFKKRTPAEFYDLVYQLIPVPKHVYGSIPLEDLHTAERARTLVGSGQFRFVKWEPKVRIELVADTANYRGRPKLDRIIMSIIADGNVGMTQVLTGQADFLQNFPIDQVATLDSSKLARPMSLPTFSYTYAGFNTLARKSTSAPHPVFGDARVRRALSMGVDRPAMLANVFGGVGRLGHGPFPMAQSAGDSTIKLPPYDTTAAKALLDSAGWHVGASGVREKNGRPLRFSILNTTTSLPRKQYGVLLQEQFRKLGAQADIETLDAQGFEQRTRAGDYDIVLWAWTTDPAISGYAQTWTTSAIGDQGQNILRYSNRRVDALLDSASASFDRDQATALARRAFQVIADDVPAIWLYDVVMIAGIHRRMNVGVIRPDGWSVDMGSWSVDPAKRIDRDRIGLNTP